MSESETLTEKQCSVLDLLIDHKTSKEIARELGISPHTVDQRISLARGKLGVSSRNELAARYRAMREASGEAPRDNSTDRAGRHNDGSEAFAAPGREKLLCPTASSRDYKVVPRVFEGDSGWLWRLGAIVAISLLLITAILVLLAVFGQINQILA